MVAGCEACLECTSRAPLPFRRRIGVCALAEEGSRERLEQRTGRVLTCRLRCQPGDRTVFLLGVRASRGARGPQAELLASRGEQFGQGKVRLE